jgi:PLP dependent protein
VSLASVRARVEAASRRSGRDSSEVTLVVVGKGRSVEAIGELYEAGHRDFGENRANELAEKASVLPSDIRWHFVGHLQSNKARVVRPLAAMLHSLDRRSLAEAWLKGSGPPPPVLVQVNIGREPQKSGAEPERALEFASEATSLGLSVVGLMAIVPIVDHAEAARPYFSALATLRDEIAASLPSVTELSMGMTDDFEVAIEEGATCIRVGRAIFEPDHNSA